MDSKERSKGIATLVVLVVVLIVLAIGSGGYFAYGYYQKNVVPKPVATTPVAKATATPTTATSTATPTQEMVVDEGVTWQEPQNMKGLGFFRPPESSQSDEYQGTNYYKVGKMKDGGNVVLATNAMQGMGIYLELHRFIERDSKYYRIVKNSAEIGDNPDYQTRNFIDDKDFEFKSLLPDSKIEQGSTLLTAQKWDSVSEDDLFFSRGDKVATTKWGPLYLDHSQTVEDSDNQVEVDRYYIKLNDSTIKLYEPAPSFVDDKGVFDITWTNKTGESLKFEKMRTGGCGLGGGTFPALTSDADFASAEVIGQDAKGSKVYTITDEDNLLVKYGYKAYNLDELPNKKSITQFVSDLGLIFWKDDYGQTITYMSTDYLPQVECAKPVIYLYPEKETKVNVKVGADIKISEPNYGKGWEALAQPSGQLTVDGQKYDSLFWEGLGWGTYPSIKSGTVVKRAEVEKTIKSQLATIGLNNKEIADFLEFWMPKMPATPYVRLSWLLNDEMNKLAPLQVTPRPQSVIRVFLDFEGLGKPTTLPSQKLPTLKREGFTLVEWGGLLKR